MIESSTLRQEPPHRTADSITLMKRIAAFPPSLLLLLTSVFTASYTYYTIFSFPADAYIAAAASVLWIIFIAVKLLSRQMTAVKIILLVILILSTASASHYITKKTAIINAPESRNGIIISTTDKRYTKEHVLEIINSDGATSLIVLYSSIDSCYKNGDTIEFTGKTSKFTGKTCYEQLMLRRGIYGSAYIDQRKCKVTASQVQLRDVVRRRLFENNAIIFRDKAALVNALIFGNANAVGKQELLDFKRSGVLHILAASGLNIGIVSALPLFLIGTILLKNRTAYLTAAALVFAYLYLTDMPVSLLRAAVMFWLIAFQEAASIDKNMLNTLLLSALIIAGIFPYDIYSLSFQLSFGATLGLILFYRPVLKRITSIPLKISDSFAITIAAQAFVIPLIAVYMNEINFSGLLANIAVVPLSSIILILSSLADMTSFFSIKTAVLFGKPVMALCAILIKICGFFLSLPGHFHIETSEFIFLSPLVLLPFFSLFGKTKRTFCMIAAVSFTLSYLLLSAASCRKEVSGNYAFIDGRESTYTVTGPVDTAEKLEKTVSVYSTQRFKCMRVVISDYTPENIRNCTNIIKYCRVNHIFIVKPVIFSYELEKLFTSCEKDGIVPQIIDIDKAGGNAIIGSSNINLDFLKNKDTMQSCTFKR